MKDRPSDERMFRRQEESVPLLNELFDAYHEIQSAELFLLKSPLGQVFRLRAEKRDRVAAALYEKFLNIDNNVSERTLRAFPLPDAKIGYFSAASKRQRSRR
ncbi:hypothetical protein FACS189443_6550 [Planctomycetales bacterium]|nr:hypothetical protein FACS189443_6550 [Planctomycetales bacterium]